MLLLQKDHVALKWYNDMHKNKFKVFKHYRKKNRHPRHAKEGDNEEDSSSSSEEAGEEGAGVEAGKKKWPGEEWRAEGIPVDKYERKWRIRANQWCG